MTTAKYLGIWMDHANAHLMEYNTGAMTTQLIQSKFTHEIKEHLLSKGEKMMHNAEQHGHAEYYKELGQAIKQYEAVILFGPTDAKVELLNLLRADHLFEKIQIETKQADKMTEHQQHAFVKDYFSKKLMSA